MKKFMFVLFVLVAAFVLAACDAVTVQEPVNTVVPSPTATLVPTKTATAEATTVPTQSPTETPSPTATLLPTETPLPTAESVERVTTAEGWSFDWYAAADKDRGDGTTFRQAVEKWTLDTITPELWPTFPNEQNPLVPEFRVVVCEDDPTKSCVPDGLEYANAESNFCQQLAGEACRVPVAARHYFYFTGDYDLPSVGSCEEGGTDMGCMLVIVNVGDVTADFTGGVFNQGFRLHARYWNGDELDMAMWALTSHGSNVMMNLDSPLNPDDIANAGANCSIPGGCQGVNVRVVFVSGNEPLLMLTTKVSR